MGNFKYFIYDVLNISGEKEIKIEDFEFNSGTLVYDFYNVLYKKYVIDNSKRLGNNKELIKNISFKILDIISNPLIDDSSFDLFFNDIIENHDLEKVYCVEPIFPIGDVVAKYRNYKIVIHSNEDNHQNFPHVHVYDQIGQNAYVSLTNFEMSKGLFMKRKDKNKILDYIKDNKEYLTNFYNQVIEHKEKEKVVIDKIL